MNVVNHPRVRAKTVAGEPTRSKWTAPFVLLMGLAGLGFMIAGGARDDILSLLAWRPLSAMALALAVAWTGRKAWSVGRPLVIFSGLMVALVAAQLIPLPPILWSSLPGHQEVVQIYSRLGMALPWQPLTLAQGRTWNALFCLAAPIAALLLTLSMRVEQNTVLLRAVVIFGLISGLLGLLQAIGPVYGPLYFYSITNNGDGVGLFANRNHQALMLAILFPLLSAYLSLWNGRPDRLLFQRIVVAATAVFLVPLVLVTGSRAGLLLSVVALGLSWWVYEPPLSKGRRVSPTASHLFLRIGIMATLFVGLIAITALASRASALHRLLYSVNQSEIRVQALPTILFATRKFFPLGSGVGSFVETYKLFEPYNLLSPVYLNHAHDDYVEVLLTAGVPGLLLILGALAMLAIALLKLAKARKTDEANKTTLILARTGASTCVLLALASLTDYPLRVPSIEVFGAIAAAWTMLGYRACRSGSDAHKMPHLV